MKTKVVYVLVCKPEDVFIEQAWVSIFSLKYYNPNVKVSIVSDKETSNLINSDNYDEMRKLIDEIVPIPFNAEVSNLERSRYLKTNLRNLINGDYLFVDTDTVVTGDLSEIDLFDGDIGMVLDLHTPLKLHQAEKSIRKSLKDDFGIILKPSIDYYNSGVMYVKDNEITHAFYKRWHEIWNQHKHIKNGCRDQRSLAVTINELGVVKPMDGSYNCQVLASIEYFTRARIVHFFNKKWSDSQLSCFYGKEIYLKIKAEKHINSIMSALILDCRSTFVSPSMPIGMEDIKVWDTSLFRFLKKLKRNHLIVFRMLNKLAYYFLKL